MLNTLKQSAKMETRNTNKSDKASPSREDCGEDNDILEGFFQDNRDCDNDIFQDIFPDIDTGMFVSPGILIILY